MRRVIGLVFLLGCAAHAGRPRPMVDSLPPEISSAFRRCWSEGTLEREYCRGRANLGHLTPDCRPDAERDFVDAPFASRRGWLLEHGCPVAVVDDTR